jgi:hypothetical protein
LFLVKGFNFRRVEEFSEYRKFTSETSFTVAGENK